MSTGPCGITVPAESTSSIDVKRSSGRSENQSDSETGGVGKSRVRLRGSCEQPRVRKKKRRRDEDRQRDACSGCFESNECLHGYRLVAMRRQRKLSIDPALRDDFGRRLRSWYRRNARDLPWRRTRSPYEVLVSELMLQQTQVSRVIPKYGEFLGQFPTLGHVARAPSGRVAEAWEGLGYYARARNLHRLAVEVTEGGSPERQLPADPAALRALPGVGAYTAGAVASFAYERRAALVDTNVARVLRRVFAPSIDAKTHKRASPPLADRRVDSPADGSGNVDAQPGAHGAWRAGLHGPYCALRSVPSTLGLPVGETFRARTNVGRRREGLNKRGGGTWTRKWLRCSSLSSPG